MRGILTTAKILIAAALLTGGCARAQKHETDPETVRAEILAIENRWATAIEPQDAAAFERLAAEDFRFIDENGRVLNRAQYIAYRSHNPDNEESAVQDEIEVRQYGDAALATGRSIIHGTRDGAPFVYRFRWTDVYVRRGGPMASCLGSTDYAAAVGMLARTPNHAMEPTAIRRTIQLHMSSIPQLAATRALPRGRSSYSR